MAAPTQVAFGTQVAGGNIAIVPGQPAGVAIDDIGILEVESANQAVTLSDPQGFVEFSFSPVGTGTAGAAGAVRLTLFWCRYTTTTPIAPTVAATGDHAHARIGAYRGVPNDAGEPFDVVGTAVLAVPDTAVLMPGITTRLDACRILQYLCNAVDSAASQVSGQANADIAGFVERYDGNTSSGVGGGTCLMDGTKALAGAITNTTGTLAAASAQAMITLALRSLAAFAGGGAQPAVILTEGY